MALVLALALEAVMVDMEVKIMEGEKGMAAKAGKIGPSCHGNVSHYRLVLHFSFISWLPHFHLCMYSSL